MAEHVAIVSAALESDAQGAGVAMLDHLRRTGAALAETADLDPEV